MRQSWPRFQCAGCRFSIELLLNGDFGLVLDQAFHSLISLSLSLSLSLSGSTMRSIESPLRRKLIIKWKR